MKEQILRYIAIFFCICSTAFGINSPEVRCIKVTPNGNVSISWAIPADPLSEFKSYEIYYSANQGGPYAPIFSEPSYGNNHYTTTTGYNANAARLFFYVRVKNISNIESPAIDTVGTINLLLTSPPDANIADFQWTNFHNPIPAGESSFYKVYREYPVNNWTLIGTKAVNTTGAIYYFHDTINVCHDSINYKVVLFDPYLADSSVSSIKGDSVKDKTPPSPPLLDSISVDANGNVIMGIDPSYSQDTKCYVIYKWIPSLTTYSIIGTVCVGNTSTIFTYTNSNANSASEQFSVAGIDSCGNLGVIALNNQATIYATASYDICSKTASLSWNPYKNMNGGVHHYEVLYSTTGGAPYFHLADTTATVYFHRNLVQGLTYLYRIRAHSVLKNLALRDSITSTSNTDTLKTLSANQPSYVYLSDVTVNNPAEDITIKWSIDKTVRVGGFNIYRSDNFSGPFSNVGLANYTGQTNYSFADNSAKADKQKYYYYAEVLDTCMTPIKKTDVSNSIFLTAASSGNFKVILNWNDYSKWLGGVTGYNIYRSLDGVFSGGPIANVPFGTNTYIDDVSAFSEYSGKFTYYVEAMEGPGNTYGLSELCESNTADVYVDAIIYVPNAFVPKGHNKIFLPIGDYVEKTDYKLSIFDRWGTKIYETQEETQGWDGGSHTEGLFGYLIEYKNAKGEYRSQRGSVTLIR